MASAFVREKNVKTTLDKIRLCTDVLNYVRYQDECEPESDMCLKHVQDPVAEIPDSEVNVSCLRRSLVPIIFIIGGPGSGKGRQSELIVQRFGFTHISLGDIVRSEIKSDSNLGRIIAPIVSAGNLVPKNIIIALLKSSILNQFKGSKGFLIDGFPRDEDQAVAFESEIARAHLVIFLEARDSTLVSRLMNRRRADDDVDVIANRLRLFHNHCEVLKRSFGHRCRVVSAEGHPLVIFNVINDHINKMLQLWGF